ncbi:ATP-binding protein [Bacillus badius]|uniref:ATP-binding protein n=1 Tax=Bacillus badius TaxID=1455 RepID=UPI001CC1787F|nr:ATP-binding protein [Bacillus badius]UAT29456.1 ATP-binding protein [Bacillus badius]
MLKKISIPTSSKLHIVGHRVCEGCQSKVPIIENEKDGEIVTVSDCLTCDTKELEIEYGAVADRMEDREHEIFYEKHSVIPEDLEDASFDNYKPEHPTQKDAYKKATWYAENFMELEFTSLLLKGPYGVGKSHLAKAISDAVKAKGHTVIYIDVPQLLRKIRNTFGSDETDEAIYKAIEKADLVVFDDLGAERVKLDDSGDSWAGEVLFEMFSARTNKEKIITTNCGADELRRKYGNMGGRIVSRMMKGTKVVPVEGRDMRIPEF